MSTTPLLQITELAEAQAGKVISINEALRILEGFSFRVISRLPVGPPVGPAEGDTYIVDALTGLWSTATLGDLALFKGGIWVFLTPFEGFNIYSVSDSEFIVWDGAAWVSAVVIPPGGVTISPFKSDYIPSGAMHNDGTNAPSYSNIDGIVLKTIIFPGNLSHSELHGSWVVPGARKAGTDVIMMVHLATFNNDGLVYELSISHSAIKPALSFIGGTVTNQLLVTDNGEDQYRAGADTSVTIPSAALDEIDSLVLFKIERDSALVGDTSSSQLYIFGVSFIYETDQTGRTTAHTK